MSISVQNDLANLALSEFERPIGISIIPAGQSWRDRQKIQYDAMKGLMYKDFHGLDDFYEQMKIYSSSRTDILGPGWRVIAPLIPRNRKVLETLTVLPGLGLVGEDMASLTAFGETFLLPAEILEDTEHLAGSLL